MKLRIADSIDTVTADRWNARSGTGNPFLRHEFLAALERNGCVGEIERGLSLFERSPFRRSEVA